jgi:hypothetical protein
LRAVELCTKQDHVTNEGIRKKLGAKSIIQELIHYRQNWKLHIERMPDERIPQ